MTRTHEVDSRVIILKVDNDSVLGNVIHVRLEGLKIKKVKDVGIPLDRIEFLTITEEALGDSVLAKEGTDLNLPDFDGAYTAWKKRVESGQGAGTFNVTIKDVLDKYEKILEMQAQFAPI